MSRKKGWLATGVCVFVLSGSTLLAGCGDPNEVAAPRLQPARTGKLTALPGGGVAIDLRDTSVGEQRLERQPDGTYRRACSRVPAAPHSHGRRP